MGKSLQLVPALKDSRSADPVVSFNIIMSNDEEQGCNSSDDNEDLVNIFSFIMLAIP